MPGYIQPIPFGGELGVDLEKVSVNPSITESRILITNGGIQRQPPLHTWVPIRYDEADDDDADDQGPDQTADAIRDLAEAVSSNRPRSLDPCRCRTLTMQRGCPRRLPRIKRHPIYIRKINIDQSSSWSIMKIKYPTSWDKDRVQQSYNDIPDKICLKDKTVVIDKTCTTYQIAVWNGDGFDYINQVLCVPIKATYKVPCDFDDDDIPTCDDCGIIDSETMLNLESAATNADRMVKKTEARIKKSVESNLTIAIKTGREITNPGWITPEDDVSDTDFASKLLRKQSDNFRKSLVVIDPTIKFKGVGTGNNFQPSPEDQEVVSIPGGQAKRIPDHSTYDIYKYKVYSSVTGNFLYEAVIRDDGQITKITDAGLQYTGVTYKPGWPKPSHRLENSGTITVNEHDALKKFYSKSNPKFYDRPYWR